ncbi:MAG: YifB family Mg chelatase-like AAA ATPase [Endozoicomonadaceae bacterium]|nr:YifB family Mg chelatase-like AAA ATPase [Endozoicomonadaceae bacterium]
MSLAVVYTRACLGIEAPEVTVEVHLSGGLPALNIVGLPETAVKESKDRVRSALINAGFDFPVRRITVNLAPADLPKEGGRFDLPIALGILEASGQLPKNALLNSEFLGELSLTGGLRKVRGVLPAIMAAKRAGRALFLPGSNIHEVLLCKNSELFAVNSLLEVTAHLLGSKKLETIPYQPFKDKVVQQRDLSEVYGQFKARRALEVTAAGGHGMLMFGPPGTGKTLLAECLPGIQAPLSESERLEIASVYSLVTDITPQHLYCRPFRSPHHTASGVAMVGGGSIPKPGEITLAHQGVLFLDELPEFDRKVLEVLRQPMENGKVTISRAARQITFPSQFQLIAAMNPCPCGYYGDKIKSCQCTPLQVQRYQQKISGPLLDRIDMHVQLSRLPAVEILNKKSSAEPSEQVKKRVKAAVELQRNRQSVLNAKLKASHFNQYIPLSAEGKKIMNTATDKLSLSVRVVHRVLRVARTIADLDATDVVNGSHLSEALSFKLPDIDVNS